MSSRSQETPRRLWTFAGRSERLGRTPWLMGIVNVTPDSFSDGGAFLDPEAAVTHALQLVADGADVLDVGGESTRPKAAPVSSDEELRRVLPVIERLVDRTDVPVSIDTTKADVARRAIAAGAVIVNDVSGLRFDDAMPDVCAESGAGVICMHMQGTPQTMQDDPRYDDVVGEIRDYFEERLTTLARRGIPPERIVLDPGIGFGKTAQHNLEILSHIARFHESGRPVLVGHSRKRFLKRILGRPVEERTAGTIGVAVALALQGTDIIRVHDVAAVRDALLACRTVLEAMDEA